MSHGITACGPQVKCPALVIGYEGEQFPEGAEPHCAPQASQRRSEAMFDWLGDTLA